MFETDYTVTRATYDHLCVHQNPFRPPATHSFYSSQDLVNDYQLPTFLAFPTSQEEADYAHQTKHIRHPASSPAASDQRVPEALPCFHHKAFPLFWLPFSLCQTQVMVADSSSIASSW